MIKSAENLDLCKGNVGLFDSLMTFWGNFSLQSKGLVIKYRRGWAGKKVGVGHHFRA